MRRDMRNKKRRKRKRMTKRKPINKMRIYKEKEKGKT